MVTCLGREATSAPSKPDVRARSGEVGRLSLGGQLEVETLHPQQTFSVFFAPSKNPCVLPPHASSTAPAPRVPAGFTGWRRRSGAIRCAVRCVFALRAKPLP